jgi:hypothetical protein
MNDGGDSGYANYDHSWKRQIATINLSQQRFHGIQSHSRPVTALAFVPNGEDLVISGLDGKIQHWDLRPESCFVSLVAAMSKTGRRSFEGGVDRDPSIAIGGQLVPTCFAGDRSNKLNAAIPCSGVGVIGLGGALLSS